MPPSDQVWRLGATRLASLLASGALSPVDLLDIVLARIDRLNGDLNAVVAMDEAGARAAARESERHLRSGSRRSMMEGIPLTVKDNILVEGMPATWGSRLFTGYVPDRDELPVARLRAAGAVVLGKTNVPEFTLDGYTDNALFGVTRNPWDLSLTPGGSSGGAVASVAAGLTAVAIGTDGGGSIRRPACHAGLVGFKPSTGRVARDHGFPQVLLDFEVVGPIARTVADARLVYDIISGPSPRDRKSNLIPATAGAGRADRVRLLYVERFGDAPLDPHVATSVAEASRVFSDLGHEVTAGPLPFHLDAVTAAWPVIGAVAVGYIFDRHREAKGLVAPKFVEMAAAGAATTAPRYLAVIETIDQFRRQVAAAFEDVDVIMTPSAAALPWAAEKPFPEEIDGQPVGPRGHAVYTGWVNACGHPAINLPAAPSAGGLPIGFQLVGDFGADALLFDLAARYEAARPWVDRWPAMAG